MAVTAEIDAPAVETLAEVGELYLRSAVTVRRLVGHAVRAPEAVVEDACQAAWSRLIDHRRRVRRDGAVAWLVRTAIHEALRALRRDRATIGMSEVADEDGEYPLLGLTPALDDLVQLRARLWGVDGLPVRQRRLLWLKAVGLSYDEMAQRTGASTRAVERQLQRARHSLAASAGG